MGRKEDDKQVNVTFSKEDFEELEEYCKNNGISKTAALKYGAELLQIDRAKQTLPEQAKSIDAFMLFIGKITSAYKESLDNSLYAYEAAASKVKEELKGMETLAHTNSRLEEEKNDLLAECETIKSELSNARNELEKMKKELKQVTADSEELQASRTKCAELTQTLAEERAKHAKEIADLQTENWEKIKEIIYAK